MIPWIQVYSNLLKHPKTYALADELNLKSADVSPNAVAAGMLISLWLWASVNATDGDLSRCSDRAIAEASEYKKKPRTLVTALIETGWLNPDKKIHDWDEYATLLIECMDEQKQKTRARVQKHREKRKRNSNVSPGNSPSQDPNKSEITGPDCNELDMRPCGDSETPQGEHCNVSCNVTDTLCNAPTIPNHTVPYHLVNTGDDAGYARERELIEKDQDAAAQALGQPEMLARSTEALKKAATLARNLVDRWGQRGYAPIDAQMVFRYLASPGANGYTLDERRVELLEYAFEEAALAGCAGNWKYISGILKNLEARGIWTRSEAQMDDHRRDIKKERE